MEGTRISDPKSIRIHGGRVIDPANNIDAPQDVYISKGRIAALGTAPPGVKADQESMPLAVSSVPALLISAPAAVNRGWKEKQPSHRNHRQQPVAASPPCAAHRIRTRSSIPRPLPNSSGCVPRPPGKPASSHSVH